MAIVNYAVEMFTDTTDGAITNTSIGLDTGVFRFITGRPGYSGSPTYPKNEDDTDNTNTWYQSLLIKDGLGKASRSIDVEQGGNYGTLSGFEFVIRNDLKIDSQLQLDGVRIHNQIVKAYVVIDDKFYQYWQGRVKNYIYDETNFKVACYDDSQSVHKNLPPNVINKNSFPDIQNNQNGDSIPVCFGDIDRANIINTSKEVSFIDISENSSGELSKACGADNYDTDPDSPFLRLIHNTSGANSQIVFDTSELINKYLFVASGENADTEFGARIVGSLGTQNGKTVIKIEKPLPVTEDVFTNNYEYAAGINSGATEKTWFFRVADISNVGIVSNKQIKEYKTTENKKVVYDYNKDSNSYDDVSGLYIDSSLGSDTENATLTYGSDKISKDGDVILLDSIAMSIPTLSATDRALLIDRDRSTGKTYTVGSNNITYIIVFDVLIGEDLTDKNLDELYFCVDYDFTIAGSCDLGHTITPTDVYGNVITKTSGTWETKYYIKEGNDPISTGTFNFVPNYYYINNGDDQSESSLYDSVKNDGTDDQITSETFLLIDSEIKELLKTGSCKTLKIQLDFSTVDSADTIKVKQVSLINKRTYNVLSNEQYTTVSGELLDTTPDPDLETNNVYYAFRHILENYDGINYDAVLADSDIDYDNLEDVRLGWHVGRQITQRKNSLDYLKELCSHSFVGLYPTRAGKRKLTAWLNKTTSTVTHDESKIKRDTIRNFKKSTSNRIYNEFDLKYNYNPATKKYDSSFTVTNVDNPFLPDPDGFPPSSNELWKEYVGGINSYADAKEVWDQARDAYLRTNTVLQLPKKQSELPWYIDTLNFDSSDTSGTGTSASAWKYLLLLVDWFSRQKSLVQYSIPLSTTNITLELLDRITFNDQQYTNNVDHEGWIYSIGLNAKNDSLEVKAILDPTDGIESLGDIVETGVATDTITESGSQTDTITEGA